MEHRPFLTDTRRHKREGYYWPNRWFHSIICSCGRFTATGHSPYRTKAVQIAQENYERHRYEATRQRLLHPFFNWQPTT